MSDPHLDNLLTLRECRRVVDTRLNRRAVAKLERKAAAAEVVAAEEEEQGVREATVVAQEVASAVQERAHQRIATVVSRALEAVFDEPYTFNVIFEQKRGRTEARLVFTRDGASVDPMTAAGGGVVAIASFALRLSCILLTRPPTRRLLVLDEPFSHLSADNVPKAKALLECLSQEFDVQILMVTHITGLRMGKIIELVDAKAGIVYHT